MLLGRFKEKVQKNQGSPLRVPLVFCGGELSAQLIASAEIDLVAEWVTFAVCKLEIDAGITTGTATWRLFRDCYRLAFLKYYNFDFNVRTGRVGEFRVVGENDLGIQTTKRKLALQCHIRPTLLMAFTGSDR